MFTFKVLDDLVDPNTADRIEQYAMGGLRWRYSRDVNGIETPPVVNTPKWINMAETPNGFFSNIYRSDVDTDEDDYIFSLLYPAISKVRDMFPFESEIIRVRGGLFVPKPRGGAHIPHVDYYMPHYTLLYYVNDSDGDTILYNERVDTFNGVPPYPDRFSILERISPQKGRAVLFNGLHYHSSSIPKKALERIAINVNIIDKTVVTGYNRAKEE